MTSSRPAASWCASEGVEQSGGAAREGAAVGEVGHQVGEVVDVEDAVHVVVPRDQADGAGGVERLQVAEEDRVGLAGRDVDDDDVEVLAAVERAGRPSSVLGKRLRSMPMTGVMPEPAVTKSNLSRSEASTNSPAACSRWTSVPGTELVDEVVADQAVGHGLDGDRDAAVGARAVGQRVGAPLADAVDVDADAEVLAGHVTGPVGAGADHDRRRVGGLGVDLLDPAAQVGAGAQRREEVEEVGGQQRRGGGLGQADQAVAERGFAAPGRLSVVRHMLKVAGQGGEVPALCT